MVVSLETRLPRGFCSPSSYRRWGGFKKGQFPNQDGCDFRNKSNTHTSELKQKFATVPKASGKAGPVWEADEQKGAEGADEKTLQSLVEHNKLYEERFGHIFLVCATGKTADEMLAILQDRMRNEPAYELTVAAGEQNKITALRLHKLLTFLGTREDSSRL